MQASPVLHWPGGKGRIVDTLKSMMPDEFNGYYEPFLGGGAMFFSLDLEGKKVVLNDINRNLMGFYESLKVDANFIAMHVSNLRNRYNAMTVDEKKAFYYEIRDYFNAASFPSFSKGAWLLFLNKTGYNGLYRENKNGKYNVPFGTGKSQAMFDETNIAAVSSKLGKVYNMLCTDFDNALKDVERNDFVYFDPPYSPIKKDSFIAYSSNVFGLYEHIKLKEKVDELTSRGVYVMLSNSDTVEVRNLYKNYNITSIMVGRPINSDKTKRGKVGELIITNYNK